MLSYINHELRNPINIANGLAELSAIDLANIQKETNSSTDSDGQIGLEDVISNLFTS